jgi:hypothetical protein
MLEESKNPLKFFGRHADGNYFPLCGKKLYRGADSPVICGKGAVAQKGKQAKRKLSGVFFTPDYLFIHWL